MKRLKSKKLRWIKLPLALLGAFAVGGFAHAILSSPPATLAGNTIETANANLLLSTDGTTYAASLPGFDFNNIIPGGTPMPSNGGYNIYLKNTGGIALTPKLAMTKQPTNPNNVALDKVTVLVSPASGPSKGFTLKALLDAGSDGVALGTTTLAAAASQQYKLQVMMTADAMTGGSATLSGIDLVFGGTAG